MGRRTRRNLADLYNDDNQLLMYYLLPEARQRLCRALKTISLRHERVDHQFWSERKAIMDKYASLGHSTISFKVDNTDNNQEEQQQLELETLEKQPLQRLAHKADQLKKMVAEGRKRLERDEEEGLSRPLVLQTGATRALIDRCESKCHEILTHLANIDFELRSCESQARRSFHREMEDSITNYHRQLSSLYMTRLTIIGGHYQPDAHELDLPDYLSSQQRPKSLHNEQMIQRLLADQRAQLEGHEFWRGVAGIPYFWYTAFNIALRRRRVIQPEDKAPLRYLADVRFYLDTDGLTSSSEPRQNCPEPGGHNHRTQVLLFFFDPNPYFENRVLSKTLYLSHTPNHPEAEQKFDGLRVLRKEGCCINWRRCHFRQYRTEQAAGESESEEAGEKEEEEEEAEAEAEEQPRRPTFFNFFTPGGLTADDGGGLQVEQPKNKNQNHDQDQDHDYQLFAYIRDFVVPHAVVAYSRGHLYGFATTDGRRPLDWPAQHLRARAGYLNEIGERQPTTKAKCRHSC